MSDQSKFNKPASSWCPSCGKKNDADANYCEHCGTLIFPGPDNVSPPSAEVSPSLFSNIGVSIFVRIVVALVVYTLFVVSRGTKAEAWPAYAMVLILAASYFYLYKIKSRDPGLRKNWTKISIVISAGILVGIFLVVSHYRHVSLMKTAEVDIHWREFSPPGGKFTLSFPSEPDHHTEQQQIGGTMQTMAAEIYTSRPTSLISYSLLTFVRLPDTSGVSSQQLVQSLLTFIHNNGDTVSWYKLEGTEPRIWADVIFRRKTGEKAKGRLGVTENHYYFLWVQSRSEEINESNYAQFINSFRILAK